MIKDISAPLNNIALPLSPLRQDLEIVANDHARDGSPRWTLFDPVRHRFFQLSWRSFKLFEFWPINSDTITSEQIIQLPELASIEVTIAEAEQLESFLQINNLAANTSKKGDDFYQQKQQSKHDWWQWLVHNYLFLKIPLIRPDQFLNKIYPSIRHIINPLTVWSLSVLAISGLYLSLRQWDEFSSTFMHFFNLQGFVGYTIALILIKIAHELGHAFTLKHYGGRVPTIGIAFIVMLPVLYTDTSDSWRLTSRRQRLHVGSAGMAVELIIATLATFIWAIVDDGILRSIAFFLATTGWISSLTVNLNPFMRFDGYYLLADASNIENLQARAFAHGKAELRYRLFGLPLTGLSYSLMRSHYRLACYAWLTWLYRFFLFLGIALIVYNFFFKLLGIVLFVIEIVWFIVLPIYREIKIWWSLRESVVYYRRSWITFFIVGLMFCLVAIPWSSSIYVQGLLTIKDMKRIYAFTTGQVIATTVEEGIIVDGTTPFLVLANNDLAQEISIKLAELDLVQTKLKVSQLNSDQRDEIVVLKSEKNKILADMQGLKALSKQLVFTTQGLKEIRNVNLDLMPGNWISKDSYLFTLLPINENRQWQVRTYITEADFNRVKVGQEAIFYPDNTEISPLRLIVKSVAAAGSARIEKKELASNYGGDIPVSLNKQKRLIPEIAIHEVMLIPAPNQIFDYDYMLRGTIRITAVKKSLLGMTLQRSAAILRLELGF